MSGDLSADFSRSEFECGDNCGFDTVDSELVTVLQVIRDHFDRKITITSGCRCPIRNGQVGGRASSKHLIGRAADFKVEGTPANIVQDYIDQEWPDSYGMGRYATWTHLDSRGSKARW